jgi:transcriptional regulator GlxA family with amidase domain
MDLSGGTADYQPGFMELLEDSPESDKRASFRLGIILLPRFTLLAFSGFVDALRIVSDIGDRSRADHRCWTLIGPDLAPVRSSCGAAIAPWEKFGNLKRFDYVVVVGGLLEGECTYDPEIVRFLKSAAAAGTQMVGICTGVFALARAGLMDGYRCCVHGYHLEDFKRDFPQIETVSNQLFLVDRGRLTCAGGVASIDLAGYILNRHFGYRRARKIMPHLLIDELRPADHSQLLFLDDLFCVHDERVRSAVFLMQQNLGNPISVAEIADRVGVPVRQLERGFQRSFSASPSSYFRAMRLRRAKWLMHHTDLSITQIAIEAGFADTAHLTRRFKQEYGLLPSTYRKASGFADGSVQPSH